MSSKQKFGFANAGVDSRRVSFHHVVSITVRIVFHVRVPAQVFDVLKKGKVSLLGIVLRVFRVTLCLAIFGQCLG